MHAFEYRYLGDDLLATCEEALFFPNSTPEERARRREERAAQRREWEAFWHGRDAEYAACQGLWHFARAYRCAELVLAVRGRRAPLRRLVVLLLDMPDGYAQPAYVRTDVGADDLRALADVRPRTTEFAAFLVAEGLATVVALDEVVHQ